jgi:hypothetical protein
MNNILSDEAASFDELDRAGYVQAITRTCTSCETPFTIGIYGDWGSGKTTLLNLIRQEVATKGGRCIWFNAWLHQNDDNPALALLHTIASDLKIQENTKKILTLIGAAIAGTALNYAANISPTEFHQLAEEHEKHNFLQRDERTRLRAHFAKFVNMARGEHRERLVIFIDDLDRCRPDAALTVLEALKHYLNIDGCVYIIAADRAALEQAVSARYGSSFVGNARYLDKIIQLPFIIPPIHPISLDTFVRAQLPLEIEGCGKFLIAGLGGNPRAIKRFINVLTLNNELAKELKIKGYEPKWLCIILLMQYLDPENFQLISADPTIFESILRKHSDEPNSFLRQVLELAPKKIPASLHPYIHLTNISSAEDTESRVPNSAFMKEMKPSDALAKIIGQRPLPRTEVTKKIWDYIKKNGLQDTTNPRMINSNDELLAVFGKSQVSMFEMTKIISSHLS